MRNNGMQPRDAYAGGLHQIDHYHHRRHPELGAASLPLYFRYIIRSETKAGIPSGGMRSCTYFYCSSRSLCDFWANHGQDLPLQLIILAIR